MVTVKRRNCVGINTTMMYGDNTISSLSNLEEKKQSEGAVAIICEEEYRRNLKVKQSTGYPKLLDL